MGTLRDEVFEQLDYLSQITEVVVSPENEILASFPDRQKLTFQQLDRVKTTSYRSGTDLLIHKRLILNRMLTNEQVSYVNLLESCFCLEASPDFSIDFLHKEMRGSVELVKVKPCLEDREVLKLVVANARVGLYAGSWNLRTYQTRVLTLLNLLEEGEGTSYFKAGKIEKYTCCLHLQDTFAKAILENHWRVRDTTLIRKMVSWMDEYMSFREDEYTGTGLLNLMKMRFLVDRDQPIYSIDEVKKVIDVKPK